METTLHHQFKELFSGRGDNRKSVAIEAPLDGYRIDVLTDKAVIEIQHSGLAAIRGKVRRLAERHKVLVVKPIIAQKRIIFLESADGPVVRRRLSPRRRGLLDLFDELIHFTQELSLPRVGLVAALAECEEWRCPPTAASFRRRRRHRPRHEVLDRRLTRVIETRTITKGADLLRLLPCRDLPQPFDTGELAAAVGRCRSFAQRIAYCLVHTKAAQRVGKRGGAWLYRLPEFLAEPAA